MTFTLLICRQDGQGVTGLITCLLGAGADVNIKSVPPAHAHSSLRGMTPLTMLLEIANSEAKNRRGNRETLGSDANLKKNPFVVCRGNDEVVRVEEGKSKQRMDPGSCDTYNNRWMETAQHLLQSGGLP